MCATLKEQLRMKKTLNTLIIALASTVTSAYADDLLSVYQQALLNDAKVLKAQAQFNIVKEDITKARAVLLPGLNASAKYNHVTEEAYDPDALSTSSSDAASLTYGANLTMQLYHHKSWLNLHNAKKSAHQSDLQYQVAKQGLLIRVTQAYFLLLSKKDDLVFAKAEKEAIARQLEQTKQRNAVGLTAITDVHESQAQYDNALTAQIRAENAIYQAEEELRVITNTYPKNLSILNTDRFSTSKPNPNSANEWQRTAEAKNLELIAAKITVDIAKENINIARAGHYPTLDFDAGYNNEDNKSKAANSPVLNTYSLGVTLNVPLYSGGQIESSVRQAQNRFVMASQDLSLTHRTVVKTTRNAYNTVIADISAIKALEQSVLSAQKALEATKAGFEVGTRTIVDVLTSTRNLYNAKRNLSSTRYSYIQNVLLLKNAAGTITEADISAINAGLVAH